MERDGLKSCGCLVGGTAVVSFTATGGIVGAYVLANSSPVLAVILLFLSVWAAVAIAISVLLYPDLVGPIPPFIPEIPPQPWPRRGPDDPESPRDLLHPDR